MAILLWTDFRKYLVFSLTPGKELCFGQVWRKALHQDQVQQVLDACQIKPLSSYILSLYLTWKPLPSLGIMFYFKARYSKSSSLTLKSESHLWRPFPPFGQNLTSAKMISRCSFKISNVQIQNIQCSPFVDTVTAGHWGGAGRRPWETENLLRARQLVPHLTHNALPLFLVAARVAWQSLIA